MYNRDLTSHSKVSVIDLNNGRKAGTCVIRIKRVPNVESSNVEKKTQEMEAGISAFLQSIHYSASQDFSVELLIINSSDQPGVSVELGVYIVFRALGDSAEDVRNGLMQLSKAYDTMLIAGNYEIESFDPEEDDKFISDARKLDGKSIWSILKSESIIPSYSPVTSFYYQSGIMPYGGSDLKGILRAVSMCPGSAFVVDIMPTLLFYDEADAIDRATFLLNRIAEGFDDPYYGVIRDRLAENPYNYFDYYRQSSDSLFMANIAIIGDPYSIKPIETEAIRAMVAGDNYLEGFSTETLRLDGFDLEYSENFYTFPWNLHFLQADVVERNPFWSSADAPTTLRRMRFLFSSKEISKMMRVPFAEDGSIAGIRVKQEEHFETVYDKGVLNNENNIHLGVLKTDNVTEIGISKNSLAKHMFVTGVPGCGKTTFAQDVLYQLHGSGIPFLVIEPAKNEYRALIDIIPDLQIFTPGKAEVSLFPINPFIPPKNVTIQTYKSNLISAFEVAFDMEGPLRSLFMETIDSCYLEYGWRDSSTVERGGEPFGLVEFVKEFMANMKMKAYAPEVKNNIQTAGVVRLMNLINANYSIFDVTNAIPVDDLLNNPTIIELNAIENDTQKALITSLLLSSIFAYAKSNISPEMYSSLNHVILLEEAHVLLSSKDAGKPGDSASANSTAVELINRILAEMRAYGVALIVADQSPQKVTPDVIRSTSSKVVFRTVDSMDRNILASSINMDLKESDSLATLRPGSAYVFFEKIDRPVPIQTENFRSIVGMRDTISDDEVKRRNRYWIQNADISRPFIECEENHYCTAGCDFEVRAEARFLVSYICKKYGCNESFNAAQFKEMVKGLNSVIESRISPDFTGARKECVIRCTKVELLRKLCLTTNLELPLEMRIKLLNNPNY